MAIQRKTHVKQYAGRNAYVLIAGEDIQYKSEHGDAEHQPADNQQHGHVALQQRIVDENFRDIGLKQAESTGGKACQEHQEQAGPVRGDKT